MIPHINNDQNNTNKIETLTLNTSTTKEYIKFSQFSAEPRKPTPFHERESLLKRKIKAQRREWIM